MINVNGTGYPLRYSLRALKKFERKTKINVFSLSDPTKLSAEACAYLVYVGVEDGCKFEGIEFDMPLIEFEEYITLAQAVACFESMFGDEEKKT